MAHSTRRPRSLKSRRHHSSAPRNPWFIFNFTTSVLAIFFACSWAKAEGTAKTQIHPPAPLGQSTALANMEPKSGSQVKGTVKFENEGEGLNVSYDLSGLPKNSTHGFHVHEKGDCSSADAKTAGGHFAKIAPRGGTSKDTPEKYAGDLVPIKSDAQGRATGTFVAPRLSVEGEYGIHGRAVVIHGGPDNPAKKSPPRIACGVVETLKARTPPQHTNGSL